MSLPSCMADFVPRDRYLQKAYLVVLALSKYLIRDTPFARLCLLTLVSSFSLVISGFCVISKVIRGHPR